LALEYTGLHSDDQLISPIAHAVKPARKPPSRRNKAVSRNREKMG